MSAVHDVPGDGDPTQDAEVKVPDSSVGGDPMIPVSKYNHCDNFWDLNWHGERVLVFLLETVDDVLVWVISSPVQYDFGD